MSVQAALDISFPEPFASFLEWISFLSLDLGFLPMGCIAEYTYTESLLIQTLVPITCVALVMFSGKVRMLLARSSTEVSDIKAHHTKIALFIMFCVYPTTSATIFEVLRPCYDYGRTGKFLYADPAVECYTARHNSFILYGVFMLLLITIGVPALFSCVIYTYRRSINPPAKDDAMRMRLRASDPRLKSISFLFADYRPSLFFMEPIELFRRVLLIGGVKLLGEKGMQASLACMLALIYVFAFSYMQPFADRLTNLLAYGAQFVIFFTFLAGFIIVTQPFGYDDNVLGSILAVMVGGVLVGAAYVALKTKAAEEEMILHLREMDFRECETDMDIMSLRTTIEALLNKYEPSKKFDDSANTVIDLAGKGGRQINTQIDDGKERRSRIPFVGAFLGRSVDDDTPSFTKGFYPCYVISISNIRTMDRLLVHEDALEMGKLENLTPSTIMPCEAFTYFISQNWFDGARATGSHSPCGADHASRV